jgi:hypothetical protein
MARAQTDDIFTDEINPSANSKRPLALASLGFKTATNDHKQWSWGLPPEEEP